MSNAQVEFLCDLAGDAGPIMVRHHSPAGVTSEDKSDGTPVTIADREIGEMVAAKTSRHFPEAALYREEATYPEHPSRLKLIVDELDGTGDYSNGGREAVFAAAFVEDGVPTCAIIYAPLKWPLQTFTVSRGQGAFRNGQSIEVLDRGDYSRVAVATAGGVESELYDAEPIIKKLALDCTYVFDVKSISRSCAELAHGEIDGVLFPWQTLHDIVPGALLVSEAGGVVSDLRGNEIDYDQTNIPGFIMANSPQTHEILVKIVEPHLR